MTNKKLRWGILSTAKIGMRSVIPAMQASHNGVVTAIASRDANKAREVAAQFNIPKSFGTYAALVASSEIDAVYISLPNSMHHEWTIRAAEHGKHILCEKPMALNAFETQEMIEGAHTHKVLLMEAFMYRFHPQFARVQELIAQGTIGEVRIIRSAFCFFLNRPGDIRRNKDLGGGALMDIGCYCVNMARWVAGTEPTEVQGKAIFGKTGVDETITGILRFPKDLLAVFDASFQADYRESLQIQGTEGRIDVMRPIKPMNNPAEIIVTRGEKGDEAHKPIIHTVPAASHYQLMVEHFADAVLNGTPLLYPPEDARANMRVIDGLYVSASGI